MPQTLTPCWPRLLAVAIGAVMLHACTSPPQIHSRLIPMFGSMAEVRILDADAARSTAALDAIEALYLGFDRDWRVFGDGELGRVNAALSAGQRAGLSPQLQRLLRRGFELHELSGGLFEPRIGPLVRLWGFRDLEHALPTRAPEETSINRLREQAIAKATVHLENDGIWSEAPVALDCNALAEGAALRAGAELLRARGIDHALIDTGGDLLAVGRNGRRYWRIGVRNPLGTGMLGTVDLQSGEAVASSGRYERRFGAAGEYHHILDPRTGRPTRGSSGTTVIDRDPELADAAATTLMVAGAERFKEITGRMGVEYALLVTDEGTMLMTPGMRTRLVMAPGNDAPVPATF